MALDNRTRNNTMGVRLINPKLRDYYAQHWIDTASNNYSESHGLILNQSRIINGRGGKEKTYSLISHMKKSI